MEASWVMAICLGVIMAIILLNFSVLQSGMKYILRLWQSIDSVYLFRQGEKITNLIEIIK